MREVVSLVAAEAHVADEFLELRHQLGEWSVVVHDECVVEHDLGHEVDGAGGAVFCPTALSYVG